MNVVARQTPRAHFGAAASRSERAGESNVLPRSLIQAAENLRSAVSQFRFEPPVTHVYNPLDYAWAAHEAYLSGYARHPKRVIFLGMNPGPFGMVQTGIPFGQVMAVREWLRIEAAVGRP